jgi:hypothetical protein
MLTNKNRCCPHCGSKEVKLEEGWKGGHTKVWYLECENCMHIGPESTVNPRTACDLWDATIYDSLIQVAQIVAMETPSTPLKSKLKRELEILEDKGGVPNV